MRSSLWAMTILVVTLSRLAGDARATTVSVRVTLSQLKSICDSAGGDFISRLGGYRHNCNGTGPSYRLAPAAAA